MNGKKNGKRNGKKVVNRYFEALDSGDLDVVSELFSVDCRVFRPELPEPLVGAEAVKLVVAMAHRIYEKFRTTILDSFEDDDAVVVRLRHDAVHRGEWRTRIGTFDLPGRPTSWEAVALFRLHDGKIVEERVFRDELGMLLTAGVVKPA